MPIPTEPKKGHPNADILMQIAIEAQTNQEPWDLFEYKAHDGSWQQLSRKCTMNCFDAIRRKPRTIRIGNYDVPEPMRQPPKIDSWYFSVECLNEGVWHRQWTGDYRANSKLKAGLVHETREGAQLMLKALQSLCE